MFFMKSNSAVVNCDAVVVVVFGTKVVVHRSEVKLRYVLFLIFLSALIIMSITYPLSSRLNGLSLLEMILLVYNASKCLLYRFHPPLYVSHRNALESVVPKIALFT